MRVNLTNHLRIAFHLYKHGQDHASGRTLYEKVEEYTRAAQAYWEANKHVKAPGQDGLVKLKEGTYTPSGRIVSYWG